jgi:lipoate-protein ligase A
MTSFRLLPFTVADGSVNMAADDVLFDAATAGRAAVRFYGWSQATVSLGYFQPAAVRRDDARLAPLPWVRRPSGGQTLVHHHELTYTLALPPGFALRWMQRMHERVILPALNRLGLAGHVQVVRDDSHELSSVLCFQQPTPGDLTCAGHKIVGSAQRKRRQALLQHGAILLARSEYTLELPGIQELTGRRLDVQSLQEAIVAQLQLETGWDAMPDVWTAAEERLILEKAHGQYASADWNEKR